MDLEIVERIRFANSEKQNPHPETAGLRHRRQRSAQGKYFFKSIHSFRNKRSALQSSCPLLFIPRSRLRKCITSFHETHSITSLYSARRFFTLSGSRKSGVMRTSLGVLALRLPFSFNPASLRWRLSCLRDTEFCLIFTSNKSFVPSVKSKAASGTPLLPRGCMFSVRQGRAASRTRQIFNKKSF